MTLRNWLIGNYIVEFEQHGENKAEYISLEIVRSGCDTLLSDLVPEHISGKRVNEA